VRPDFKIEVREDVLHETDGPTLTHAIQGLHGSQIILPKRSDLRPAKESLKIRYQRFREASSFRPS
jgi:putative restriction endonuclease